MQNKRAVTMPLNYLAWWIIALMVLVLGIVIIIILQGKGYSALEYFKNLLRFGR